jgi:hypothetical protein
LADRHKALIVLVLVADARLDERVRAERGEGLSILALEKRAEVEDAEVAEGAVEAVPGAGVLGLPSRRQRATGVSQGVRVLAARHAPKPLTGRGDRLDRRHLRAAL